MSGRLNTLLHGDPMVAHYILENEEVSDIELKAALCNALQRIWELETYIELNRERIEGEGDEE